MKRLSARVLSLLAASVIIPSMANAVGFYGSVLNFDKVQGSYNSISGLQFWLNEGWCIKEIPAEAMLTVYEQPANYTLGDYLVEGDKRGFYVQFPEVTNGTTISLKLKPAFIKVYHQNSPDNVINLNEIPGATNTSTGLTTIPYYINEIDQFEHKTRIINRNIDNVPYVGGRYTMNSFAFYDATNNNIQKDIIRYTPTADNDKGKLLKKNESGEFEFVTDCDFSWKDLDFTLNINGLYTDPGEYYLQYPTSGVINCMYLNSNGTLFNQSRHISNIIAGPITVVAGDTDQGVLRMDWETPNKFYSDAIPNSIIVKSLNATNLILNSQDAIAHVSIVDQTTNQTNEFDVNPVIENNTLSFPIPESAFENNGVYTFSANIDNLIKGINDQHFVLVLPKNYTLTRTFTVSDPTHPQNIDVYFKRTSEENLEINENESIIIRLSHKDQGSGLKIFVKWTPESALSPQTNSADGFSEHTADITIDEPGQLEYYTRVSNTDSEIRTINVIQRHEAENPEPGSLTDTATDPSLQGDERWYDLMGHPVRNPSNGIYIRRSANGHSEKILR